MTVASSRQCAGNQLQVESGRDELLDKRLAANSRLLHAEADFGKRGAGGFDLRLGFLAADVELAHLRIGLLDLSARIRQLALDDDPLREKLLQLNFEFREWRFAVGELALEFGLPRLELCRLVARTLEAGAKCR